MMGAAKLAALALALAAQCALAAPGPVYKIDKHKGRKPPVSAPTTEEVVITGSDIQLAQMRAAEPTGVLSSQASFRVASWNQVDYDEAAIIRPCAAPCTGGNLLPASLQGATILSVRFEPVRSNGYFETTTTFYLKRVLRTDVNVAQMTWNVRATGSDWQTGGAQGALDAGAAMSSVTKAAHAFEAYVFTCPETPCTSESALVEYFQDLADGVQTTPWLLMHPGASQGSYNTFDGPTGTNPPRFVVTKQVP